MAVIRLPTGPWPGWVRLIPTLTIEAVIDWRDAPASPTPQAAARIRAAVHGVTGATVLTCEASHHSIILWNVVVFGRARFEHCDR